MAGYNKKYFLLLRIFFPLYMRLLPKEDGQKYRCVCCACVQAHKISERVHDINLIGLHGEAVGKVASTKSF